MNEIFVDLGCVCLLAVVKGSCADFGSGGWECGLGDVGLGLACVWCVLDRRCGCILSLISEVGGQAGRQAVL